MTDETIPDQEPEASPPQGAAPEPPPSPETSSHKEEIDRINRENAEYRQMIAGQVAAIEHLVASQGQQREQPSPPSDAEEEPRRDQYTDDVTWIKEGVSHQLNRFKTEIPKIIDETISERRKAEADSRREAGIREHVIKGRSAHHDFDQVIGAAPIDDLTLDMASAFDDPHEVLYALFKDKALSAHFSSLRHPAQRAHEMGKISAKLKATAPAQMEGIEPVRGSGATPSMRDTTKPASDKMSDKEWFEAEKARLREKLGG